jgi:tetratricopeptide (TPR) repeat protein
VGKNRVFLPTEQPTYRHRLHLCSPKCFFAEMTRSTLLHLLTHPAALTGADVRELEQLAQAFPYCQTAHLLLAKAAHDQGSMLAGQRLRRAATYAADRALLRQLIERPAPTELTVAEPVAAEAERTAITSIAAVETTLAFVAPTAPAPPEEPLIEPAETTDPAPLFEVEHTLSPEPAALPVEQPLPAAETGSNTEPEHTVPADTVPTLDIVPDTAPVAQVAPVATVATAAAADELPAQAPPIRPPAEAEAARLEFGLAEAEPAEIVAYRLPELLETEAEPASLAVGSEVLMPPVFAGVADVGYAPGEGSRLGFCLQSLAAETYSLTTGPAALLPSAALPPTSEFFAPDALLLAHLEAYQSAVAPIPAPVASDLINSFLRRGAQAGPRRRATPPPPDAEDEEQPDLSGPSTRAVPDLASENLAKILARQGKPDRAIAIYERLMAKQPEKAAYFEAQIEALRPQSC